MVQLNNVNGTLLPPTITGPIFQKANETSAVMQLARRIPLSVAAATVVPVMMDVPTAGWVTEGGAKPVSSGGVGLKQMTGKKVAVIVPVSEEVVMTNAAGLYDQLVQDLPTAIARAFDYAAIHGLDLKTGGAGPFTDYLAKTPNTQVVGSTAAAAGGVYADLWKGIQQVINVGNAGYDFTGFAADPRLRPEAALSVDSNGRPLFVDNSLNANAGFNGNTLVGYPVFFNSGVSGKYRRQGDLVQVVTINGTPTGGTFTITAAGSTTSALAYNASAATVQTALRLLNPQADWSAATATGSAGGPYTITQIAGGAPLAVDQSSLTGGTAATSQATIAQSPVLDSGLRAIGGDWGQAAYGVGMDITIRVSREANYTTDGGTTWHSAFQENLVLLLAEAYYGFVVGDPNAFVSYTHAAGS
jgi:hypothetical protein